MSKVVYLFKGSVASFSKDIESVFEDLLDNGEFGKLGLLSVNKHSVEVVNFSSDSFEINRFTGSVANKLGVGITNMTFEQGSNTTYVQFSKNIGSQVMKEATNKAKNLF